MRYCAALIIILINYQVAASDINNESSPYMYTFTYSNDIHLENRKYISIGISDINKYIKTESISAFKKVEIFYFDNGVGSVESDYLGVLASYGAMLNKGASPFVGAGLSFGENRICDETETRCTKDIFFGAHVETGVSLKITSRFNVQGFYRIHWINSGVDNFSSAGVTLFYQL